ncbi:C40 family peptidase [Cohnella massiliensis]|uniref:C40 family peptidase n=1 Tax=Cohnella massiliensis TaxID=1816691 RepID=UPI001592E8BC
MSLRMKRKLAVGFLVATFSLGVGISSLADPVSAAPVTNQSQVSSVRQNIINKGLKYLGTPYEFGSSRSNTRTFDCSDFVRQAYKEGAGITLPPDSRSQGAYVKNNGYYTTNWRDLKPGDIMFFMSYKGSKDSDYKGIDKSKERITHNGIYLGNGKILQTYSVKSGGVRIDSIAGTQWEKRFLFGGSVLK